MPEIVCSHSVSSPTSFKQNSTKYSYGDRVERREKMINPLFILIMSVVGCFLGLYLLVGKTGIKASNKQFATIFAVIILGVSIFGIVTSAQDVSFASISDDSGIKTASGIGALILTAHDGIANDTATEDTIDDSDLFLTFYSVDATIEDGEEYLWNITIERTNVASGGRVDLVCTSLDKEIDGVTAKNIVEKTAGKIDLDFEGPLGSASTAGLTSKTGRHSNGGNSVETGITFPEFASSVDIQVKVDQEETYHDGLTDLQDYADITCVVTGDQGSVTQTTRIYADS